ncbi:MAG: hypothetical protein IJP13_06915 [Lachnospiraceae bacterium]|nr:hypothetical protein [Lachnospiraceae bacterium]
MVRQVAKKFGVNRSTMHM